MELCPGFVRSDFGGGKDDAMVDNVVFAHELVELHVVWAAPPLLPLVGVIGCDRYVTDAVVS